MRWAGIAVAYDPRLWRLGWNKYGDRYRYWLLSFGPIALVFEP